MPCNCNKGAAAAAVSEQKHRVSGTGDTAVDKVYDNKTSAEMALALSGKTGTVRPA
jgi:hypothetical protein